MTRDSDFKRVVRARMAQTGETYTAARAALAEPTPRREQRPPRAEECSAFQSARDEQQRLVARLFKDGRLPQIPAKRKNRAAALLEVLTRFEPGRIYTEPEVNEVLVELHPDFAYLRRELVNYHYLERGHGRYRVVEQPPERTTTQLQEIPDWEAAWLPGFVGSTPA